MKKKVIFHGYVNVYQRVPLCIAPPMLSAQGTRTPLAIHRPKPLAASRRRPSRALQWTPAVGEVRFRTKPGGAKCGNTCHHHCKHLFTLKIIIIIYMKNWYNLEKESPIPDTWSQW